MEQQDVERIARAVFKELGVAKVDLTVAPIAGQPGAWRIEFAGTHGTSQLKIKCGSGTTAQWVRQQIFEQYQALN